MRKLFSLIAATLFLSVATYGQYYSSKQDAQNGKLSTFQKTSTTSVNRAITTTFFSDDFESASLANWTTSDADGDSFNWGVLGAPNGHDGGTCAASASWNSTAGVLTPNNWLISSAIDLSSAGASTLLDFWRKAQDQAWPSEKYAVYLSTSGNTVADFTGANGHVILPIETVTANGWQKRSISLAAYTGGTVYIAFRHYNCTNMYYLDIDDVEVYENSTVDGAITAFLSPNNSSCSKTATEDVTITIFNYGGAALTNFEASYSINGGLAVTETVSASIPAASSYNYTFTQKADLSALGYYDITASLNIASDAILSNNTWVERNIANGDDNMTINVSTDSQGGQAWYITNIVSGDTIASHGVYQWDLVNDITTVCLNNADCYNFSWVGGTSNTVVVNHGGNVIDSRTATGSYMLYGIGSGCAADDVDLTAVTTPDVVAIGNVLITGTITNTGTSNLTSYDVVYSVDGGATSAVYSGTCNLSTGQTFNFSHNVPWSAVLGSHNIEVTVNNANGNGSANSNLDKDILVINEIYPKTVVYEEGTGTWCGWCVRGLVGLNTMAHNYTDGSWIGIAVHNGDPMVLTAYDAAMGALINGYPSGVMDRHSEEVDPGLTDLEMAFNEHLLLVPEAKIEVTDQTWNSTSRAITVTVAATFALDINSANYRTAVVVVEDGVTGTTDYDQENYYSGGTYGNMTDWDGTNYANLTSPVPAANMVYNHVGRALLGGYTGQAGSVPTTVVYNTPYSYTFNYTLPAAYDANEIKLAALVLNYATGEIVNATEVDLDVNTGIAQVNGNVKLYPNPTTGVIKVVGVEGAQILVYNLVGEIVAQIDHASAQQSIELGHLANGNYMVKVIQNNQVSTQKVVLTK